MSVIVTRLCMLLVVVHYNFKPYFYDFLDSIAYAYGYMQL